MPTHAHIGGCIYVCVHVFWICLTGLSLHLGQYTTIYTYLCQLGHIVVRAKSGIKDFHLHPLTFCDPLSVFATGQWPVPQREGREEGSTLPQGARSVSVEIKHEFFK